MEHEFKVDSPIVIDRILSRNLEKCSEQLRNEILPDTTPVPFFGDFENYCGATVFQPPLNFYSGTLKESRPESGGATRYDSFFADKKSRLV